MALYHSQTQWNADKSNEAIAIHFSLHKTKQKVTFMTKNEFLFIKYNYEENLRRPTWSHSCITSYL